MLRGGRGAGVFLALFALVAGSRLALLLGPARPLHGDEATVGVLAMRILERGERPVFALGAGYNGGAAVTAYLASPLFAWRGPSELALKLIPFAWSLLALALVFLLVRSALGAREAVAAAALYGTASALMRWSLDARGAYVECQALLPLAFWLLVRPEPGGRGRIARLLALGGVCGLGVYLLPAFAPAAATCGLWLLARPRRGRAVRLALFAAGLGAGLVPLLLFGEGGALTAALDQRLWALPAALWRALHRDLPAMLAAHTLYGVPPVRLVPNGVELLALAAGVSLLARPGRDTAAVDRPLVPVLLTYTGLYLLAYALHPLAGNNARYLLFLEPALSILAAVGFTRALAGPRPLPPAGRVLLILLLGALALGRAREYARTARETAVLGPSGRSLPRTAGVMAGFLRAHGIEHAMAEDYDLRWRVMFQTRERVRVHHLSTRWFADPPPEIRSAARYALIVQAGSRTEEWMAASLARRGLRVPRQEVEGFAVYLCGAELPCAGAL